uniref:Uncharacterized protein n=1 Tax=Meloidogyne incognita TaxID=6306 RepID=A0A914L0W9_MELIC
MDLEVIKGDLEGLKGISGDIRGGILKNSGFEGIDRYRKSIRIQSEFRESFIHVFWNFTTNGLLRGEEPSGATSKAVGPVPQCLVVEMILLAESRMLQSCVNFREYRISYVMYRLAVVSDTNRTRLDSQAKVYHKQQYNRNDETMRWLSLTVD